MATCLIGLGSNLGDRARLLDAACERLQAQADIAWRGASRYLTTPAVGGPAGQGPFLNAAALVDTSLAPHQLLAVLREIETELGRQRRVRWDARPIDLDLLLYDDLQLDTPTLQLPHPRMAFRRFVLGPASEVAAEMVHPPTGWTIARLWQHLNTATDYVALAGIPGAGKSHLASETARLREVRLLRDPLDDELPSDVDADPAGRSWATEIEFVAQRRRLLERGSWPADERWTISDFWFDQLLAQASVKLDETAYQRFVQVWHEADRHVVHPKLTVWLDPPVEAAVSRTGQRGGSLEPSWGAERLEQLATALRRQIEQPDRGPVLRLTQDDPDAAVGELTAALDAMQRTPRSV